MSNEPQNLTLEENSIPASPQEPTADAPIPPIDSEHTDAIPDAPESSPSDFPVKSTNIPPSNSTLTDSPNEEKPEEKSAPNEPNSEPVSEPKQAPELATAQIPVSEPFAKLSLLAKAREAIQFRKRKKLEKIMGMFLKQANITNDDVEKLLHVSDATATRYLEQLERGGKVRQNGRTGKPVSYSRM